MLLDSPADSRRELLAGLLKIAYFAVLVVVDSVASVGPSRRCLHDSIADTRVVTAASSQEATLAGARGQHLRTIDF